MLSSCFIPLIILLVWFLSSSIKQHKIMWLLFALVLNIAFIVSLYITLPSIVSYLLFVLMQKGTLALSLFILVMYLGVFPTGSKVRIRLMPIRAELSIIACFLVIGHMVFYLSSYLSRLKVGMLEQMQTNVFVSLIISFVLLVLLLVLGVTSFNFVRKRMNKQTWKSVQKFAYLFFILIYVHLIFMIGPAALKGSSVAIINLSIYSIIFIGYVILRLYRARVEKDTKMSKSVSV